jgi:hypothetical protein
MVHADEAAFDLFRSGLIAPPDPGVANRIAHARFTITEEPGVRLARSRRTSGGGVTS